MGEAPRPVGPLSGRPERENTAEATDPLIRGGYIDGGDDAPVELEAPGSSRDVPAVQPEYGEESELEPEYGEELELEPADDEEFEPEPADDEELEFDPRFGPGEHPGHHRGPGHGREPKLAPGPMSGPGHRRGPAHEHGPGKVPGKKAPGKKVPGKKAPGKKAPGKKVAGPAKYPGHPPPPRHEHEAAPGSEGPGSEPDFDPGPDADFGFASGPDFGFDFDSGPRGRRRGSGPGRRGRRGRPGDVRAAILALLAEHPMHGYEMIQEIAERSHGLWRPSPGSIYPTLQLLDDEGLIASSESPGSQKLFELTEQGRSAVAQIDTPPWEKIARAVDSGQVDLRMALRQLSGAVAQAAYVTTADQQRHIAGILKDARREIYTLLAESD